ncbi:hypothetical protein ACQKMD_13620 [Viridibacillus sp. NPDC096237]|uniref:hypothetical protein n=1 Tax=Viridibacillus sp. NPDC096237 TaxID=3390721 RepID=UPI003D05B9A7
MPKSKINWQFPVVLASAFVVCIILFLTTLNGPLQKVSLTTATESLTNFTSTVKLGRIYYIDWSKDIRLDSFLVRSSKLYLDINTIENQQQLSIFSNYFSHLKEVQHINKSVLTPFNDFILKAKDGREWNIKIYENPGEPPILRDMETNRYFEVKKETGNFDDDLIKAMMSETNFKSIYNYNCANYP